MRKRDGARLTALLAATLLAAGCDDITGVNDFLNCDEVRRIQLPATIDGDLTTSDCRFPDDGTLVDYYEFSIGSTRTVTIDMVSDDLDSYLYLLDEDGRVIDENDDAGFGLDAGLTVRLPRGRYVIAVNTYQGERGFYRLFVE